MGKIIPTIAKLTITKFRELFPKYEDKNDPSIPYVYLDLKQYLLNHAEVEIKIDITNFGKDTFNEPLLRIKLLNEKFQIDIQKDIEDGEKDAYGFVGIITDIKLELNQGEHSWMYVYGASPSIELERGKRLRTFTDSTLEEIVGKVTKDCINLKVTNKPRYEKEIPFSMQYHETDYQYIKRLAATYNENCFFSGDSLVFGQFDEKCTADVTYGYELTNLQLKSHLIANKFENYYFQKNEKISPHMDDTEEPDTFMGEANLRSGDLNLREPYPQRPIVAPTTEDENLKELTKREKQANMNKMFTISGTTNQYYIRIGGLLEINFGNVEIEEALGLLRVTKVRHYFEQNEIYYNEFEACQTIFPEFPYEDVEIPIAQPIEATVFNCSDEKGWGRVQLRFDFEEETCKYWFRSLTPDGGGNKSIGKERNRGMIFVKEPMDRVLVGFIGGNPDKPFIMGSLFHDDNSRNLGGGKGNHIRSISDKANNYIQWNSAAGIMIMDQGGNKTHLDGGGNITIQSSESIKLICKKDGGGDGTSIEMDSAGKITINGNEIEINAKKDNALIKLDSEKDINIISIEKNDITSSNNTITGKNHITGGDTTVDGGVITLN